MEIEVSEEQIPTTSVYDLLINQMNQELVNSRYYLTLSNICDNIGYIGAKNFFKKQSDDELEHFKKINTYISMRNWIPVLKNLEEMEVDLTQNLLSMFANAYELEKLNLKFISNIIKNTLTSSDFESFYFLSWFVENQTAEIDEMLKWRQKFEIASDSPAAILFLDAQLGEV